MTKPTSVVEETPIRPFHLNVPKAELTELRRRINATKWPEQEAIPATELTESVASPISVEV